MNKIQSQALKQSDLNKKKNTRIIKPEDRRFDFCEYMKKFEEIGT